MIESLGLKPIWQSASLSTIPALLEGEIHVWWLPLKLTKYQKPIALKLLSDIQRDRYARRASRSLKEAYLAGRYFLLHLLAAYTNLAPSQIQLSYTRLNKPYLNDDAADLHFNFTDTSVNHDSYGVFAFTLSGEIGVDIEARQRSSNFSTIADRRFSAREREFVYEKGVINPEKFLAIWTRKEAFGKATGQGINFKMNRRDLSSNGEYELEFTDEYDQAWRLLQLQLGEKFIACVVHASHQALSLKAFNALEI